MKSSIIRWLINALIKSIFDDFKIACLRTENFVTLKLLKSCSDGNNASHNPLNLVSYNFTQLVILFFSIIIGRLIHASSRWSLQGHLISSVLKFRLFSFPCWTSFSKMKKLLINYHPTSKYLWFQNNSKIFIFQKRILFSS